VERRPEKRHDLIADEFIERAVILKNRLGRQHVKAVEPLRHFGRRQPLRQRRKAAHVDEQDRYVADLPARGSQLVSERAEVGILARRPDLHQPVRNRKHPQERHQTFLTPFSRGEPAMKPARDLRRAQGPPQSYQSLFHRIKRPSVVRQRKIRQADRAARGGGPRASLWHLPLRPWGGILSKSPRPRPGLASKGRSRQPQLLLHLF